MMGKPTALFLAVSAVLCLVFSGISLSYEQPWIALLLFLLFFGVLAVGFVLKAKMRKIPPDRGNR